MKTKLEASQPDNLVTLFQSHTLDEQNAAALMNRVDKKYLLPRQVLPDVMSFLARDYSILTLNNKSVFTYETTYFDTDKDDFYFAHHNGKLNRQPAKTERITVDLDLEFESSQGDHHTQLPSTWIVEIKSKSKSHLSPVAQYLKSLGFLPSSFSKYCMGRVLTDSGTLKRNRFKSTLKTLRKFENFATH